MTTRTETPGALTYGKFRKKPVVIEAAQWFKNGDHPLDYSKDHDGFEGGELRTFSAELRKANNWEGDVVRYFRRPDIHGDVLCRHCLVRMHDHGWIDTLEGGHIVCPGDFIITGVKGELYPCKPNIFEATYEPAERAEAELAVLKSMANDDRAHLQTIDERDAAEESLSQAFYLVVGRSPEWSNLFGHAEALEEIEDRVSALKAALKSAQAPQLTEDVIFDAVYGLELPFSQMGKGAKFKIGRRGAKIISQAIIASLRTRGRA